LLRHISVGFMLLTVLLFCPRSHADVGLVLNDSLDTSVARITGSGHSAIYLSRICPETPVKMRLCRPDEPGSVISNYTTLGEDQRFEWNVIPLNMFIYGVADPKDRPLFASWKIKHLMEDDYRSQALGAYCETQSCQTSNKAEWREMVGATSERTFYILVASTSLQQDKALIEKFNSGPNVNHFNAATRNCADFAKDIINEYFPHAAHRDILNDFGATSPKTVARTFAHYADHRPEIRYYVLHFAQLPGTIKRSTPAREGTEQLYRAKRLAVPLAVIDWHMVPPAAMAYLFTGKFDPQREYEFHATPEESELFHEKEVAQLDDDDAQAKKLDAAEREERFDVLGSGRDWKQFRTQFDASIDKAIQNGSIPNRDAIDHVFKNLSESGTAYADDHGGLWMKVHGKDGSTSVVGVSASTVLAPDSDRKLAYEIILANIDDVLRTHPRTRETLPQFKQTWDLLEQAQKQTTTSTYVAEQGGH
jgi:hypothetical protein